MSRLIGTTLAIWSELPNQQTLARCFDNSLVHQLSELVALNAKIRKKHPEVTAILWDYNSSYYSWGILASAGGYVFGKKGKDYDPQDVGVATPGAIDGFSEIISLIRAGVLPKSVTYSMVEELMARGGLP